MSESQVPRVTRAIRIPDELRIARSLRAPELGPRILFLSGGSALRATSRKLKHRTHNSVHLITPFDSGGSSARLREAFSMLSVGDLRNRLMALADDSVQGNPAVYALFAHRLPRERGPRELLDELGDMLAGRHPLVSDVLMPMQRIVRTHLRCFVEAMPPGFDLRGASIGNLILAGGCVQNEGEIEPVLFTFAKLVEARGHVWPTVTDPLHLLGVCADGSCIVGQHNLTGRQAAPLTQPIVDLRLVKSPSDPTQAAAELPERNRRHFERADLICYPMGSFFTSVAANLLPSGVGRAIRGARCPKLYVPNTGRDPEQLGHDVGSCIETLARLVRRDAGEDTPLADIVNLVLVDTRRGCYERPIDAGRLEALGVTVLDADLASDESRDELDAQKLADALISLA